MWRTFLSISVMMLALESTVAQSHTDAFTEKHARLRLISQTISEEIPLVIAHRGASGYLPEHTTEATAFAHAIGADYIEQDVVLTKDGIAVVLHDTKLDSVTNVADVFSSRSPDGAHYVWDYTLAELKQLNVRERRDNGQRFPQQQSHFRIATLEEQLQLIQGMNKSRQRNVGVYVEIKSPAQHRKAGIDPSPEVLRLLAKYGYESADARAFVQCFDEAEVLRLRTELKCRLPLVQLLSDMPDAKKITEVAKVADAIGVHITKIVSGVEDDVPVISKLVATAHEHALMVHVYTLRTDELPPFTNSTELLLDWLVKDAGVDGIFADQPDVLLDWRTKQTAHVGRRGPFHLLRNGAASE